MTPHYGMMLFSQSLMMLLAQWDQGRLPSFPRSLLKQRVLPVLFGMTFTILEQQDQDGSWGHLSRETTAYAVITLASVASLPLCDTLRPQIELTIRSGRAFLQQQVEHWAEPDFIWRGKAVYGLGILAEAYTIAAMRTSSDNYAFSRATTDLCAFKKPSLHGLEHVAALPMLAEMPDWLVKACILEGYLYLPIFDAARQQVFTHKMEQQRQFTIVPFALIASARMDGAAVSPEVNVVFMVLCALLYEIDHYMEDVISSL